MQILLIKNLIFRRYANQNNRYTVSFENCEIKEGLILASKYGQGKSLNEALLDYINQIKGQILVFNAMSAIRQEFTYPKIT